jgi:Tol biopolymer transport system component
MRSFGLRRSSVHIVALSCLVAALASVAGRPGTAAPGEDAARQELAARLAATTERGNGLIAFTTNRTGNNEIFTMFVDGNSQTNRTSSPADDRDPAWSPGGDRIAFASNRSGNDEIWVMDPDGSNPVKLTNDPASDSQPAWSADGLKLAWVSNRAGSLDVWLMNANGSNVKRLTKLAGAEIDPAWAPNNQRIAFTSDKAGTDDVWTVKTNGRGYKNLTNHPAADSQPAWNPAGDRIAFTTNRTGDLEVFVMKEDGTNPVNFTNRPADQEFEPTWSPDRGSKILFTSDRKDDLEIYFMRGVDGTWPFLLSVTNVYDDFQAHWQPMPPYAPAVSPIEHVVFLVQENHSFDNVFGPMCVMDDRCNGAMQGRLNDGTVIDLPRAQDMVAKSPHSYDAHIIAINDGQMNGFELMSPDCSGPAYRCHEQYYPDQIPSLTALARTFALSDMTFETDGTGSYGTHLSLAASWLAGFYKATHHQADGQDGFGVGCDSGQVGAWQYNYLDLYKSEPTCVPTIDGQGAFEETPVYWTASIMDRMTEQGVPWKIYGAGFPASGNGYGWSICPTFATCLSDPAQKSNFIDRSNFFVDAANGDLPAFSFLIPDNDPSQHNSRSMLLGDNWIADVANAVMDGPDWNSTALFITYDDAGIFYDHVPPPETMTDSYYLGIRMPMVIVSPWAKPGYTDSNIASWASVLAFVEKRFGLAPLSDVDRTAYDYSKVFDFTQRPLPPITLRPSPVPAWELRWMKENPLDENDPT